MDVRASGSEEAKEGRRTAPDAYLFDGVSLEARGAAPPVSDSEAPAILATGLLGRRPASTVTPVVWIMRRGGGKMERSWQFREVS